MSSKGSHKRTFICSCGWSCKKPLRDANSAFERHQRYCEIAKSIGVNPNEMPVNKQVALNNGDYKKGRQNATNQYASYYTNEITNEIVKIDKTTSSKTTN